MKRKDVERYVKKAIAEQDSASKLRTAHACVALAKRIAAMHRRLDHWGIDGIWSADKLKEMDCRMVKAFANVDAFTAQASKELADLTRRIAALEVKRSHRKKASVIELDSKKSA